MSEEIEARQGAKPGARLSRTGNASTRSHCSTRGAGRQMRVQPRTGSRDFWVPQNCTQLRDALRKQGITHIAGRPVGRVKRAQLYAVWFQLWRPA